MPARMLRHKALMQGVRVAFGFGGVYDEDEARDVAMRDVTPATEPTKPKFLNAAQEAEPEPEASPVTTEVVEEVADDSDQREALLSSIQEAMDADCITATQVRKWAHKNRLAESDKLALKSLPTDSLSAILNRWPELKGGVES
jgi:hypothetical protein